MHEPLVSMPLLGARRAPGFAGDGAVSSGKARILLVQVAAVGVTLGWLGQPAAAGLIADWEFEGNVNDSTGSFDATAVNGPGYATGIIDQAISLNGVNQSATVPDMGTYGDATVAVWIKTNDANSPGSQAIFHNTAWSTGTPHFLLEYGGGSPSPATTGLVIGVNSSGEVKLNNALSPIDEDVWYHVAYTYDTSVTPQLRLYIDGAEAGSDSVNSSVDLIFNNMVIGAGFGRPFNGLLDDLGVWDEVLSATEVKGIASFATSPLNYGQADVAELYGLTAGQSTVTSDGTTWDYATGLSGPTGEVEWLGGTSYAMNLGGGTGVLTVSAVPEPGSLAMLAAGLLGVAGLRRRAGRLVALAGAAGGPIPAAARYRRRADTGGGPIPAAGRYRRRADTGGRARSPGSRQPQAVTDPKRAAAVRRPSVPRSAP